jgi:hypothetical protein
VERISEREHGIGLIGDREKTDEPRRVERGVAPTMV